MPAEPVQRPALLGCRAVLAALDRLAAAVPPVDEGERRRAPHDDHGTRREGRRGGSPSGMIHPPPPRARCTASAEHRRRNRSDQGADRVELPNRRPLGRGRPRNSSPKASTSTRLDVHTGDAASTPMGSSAIAALAGRPMSDDTVPVLGATGKTGRPLRSPGPRLRGPAGARRLPVRPDPVRLVRPRRMGCGTAGRAHRPPTSCRLPCPARCTRVRGPGRCPPPGAAAPGPARPRRGADTWGDSTFGLDMRSAEDAVRGVGAAVDRPAVEQLRPELTRSCGTPRWSPASWPSRPARSPSRSSTSRTSPTSRTRR